MYSDGRTNTYEPSSLQHYLLPKYRNRKTHTHIHAPPHTHTQRWGKCPSCSYIYNCSQTYKYGKKKKEESYIDWEWWELQSRKSILRTIDINEGRENAEASPVGITCHPSATCRLETRIRCCHPEGKSVLKIGTLCDQKDAASLWKE